MKKIIVFLTVLFISLSFICADAINNNDKPSKGEYIFPLEKVWSVDGAGGTPFGLLVGINISDSGLIYGRDLKNKVFYIFDKNGKFLKQFGEQGEAPGKIQAPGGASILLHKNIVMIEDAAKIHYYDSKGNFTHSVVNNSFTKPVTILINEHEFISAPRKLQNVKKGNAQVKYINLKTKKERVITDFTLFNSGVFQRVTNQGNVQANATIPTITPVMVINKHQDYLYFGMNSKYEVFISDLEGKLKGSFTLKRTARNVTLKEKEDVMMRLIKGFAPPAVGKQLAKTLPNTETFFVAIQFHNNLVHVWRSHFPAFHQQQIDIFSKDGKYLYKAFVRLEDGSTIISGPVFNNGFIYLAWENEEGDSFLSKFKTTLPK